MSRVKKNELLEWIMYNLDITKAFKLYEKLSPNPNYTIVDALHNYWGDDFMIEVATNNSITVSLTKPIFDIFSYRKLLVASVDVFNYFDTIGIVDEIIAIKQGVIV